MESKTTYVIPDVKIEAWRHIGSGAHQIYNYLARVSIPIYLYRFLDQAGSSKLASMEAENVRQR